MDFRVMVLEEIGVRADDRSWANYNEAVDVAAKLGGFVVVEMPFSIEERFADALKKYEAHIPPGEFLQRVLEGDLDRAAAHGDDMALMQIGELIKHVRLTLPRESYGSPQEVRAWLYGPRCGHQGCASNFIDTGYSRCIEHKDTEPLKRPVIS